MERCGRWQGVLRGLRGEREVRVMLLTSLLTVGCMECTAQAVQRQYPKSAYYRYQVRL